MDWFAPSFAALPDGRERWAPGRADPLARAPALPKTGSPMRSPPPRLVSIPLWSPHDGEPGRLPPHDARPAIWPDTAPFDCVLVELPGNDHMPWAGSADDVAGLIGWFVGRAARRSGTTPAWSGHRLYRHRRFDGGADAARGPPLDRPAGRAHARPPAVPAAGRWPRMADCARGNAPGTAHFAHSRARRKRSTTPSTCGRRSAVSVSRCAPGCTPARSWPEVTTWLVWRCMRATARQGRRSLSYESCGRAWPACPGVHMCRGR